MRKQACGCVAMMVCNDVFGNVCGNDGEALYMCGSDRVQRCVAVCGNDGVAMCVAMMVCKCIAVMVMLGVAEHL